MSKKITLIDDTRVRAKSLEHQLIKSLPEQWITGIRALARGANTPVVHPSRRVYITEDQRAWFVRLREFADRHGDAFRWAMPDADICKKAKELARSVTDFATMWPEQLTEAERLDVVLMVCSSCGVEPPKSLSVTGAIARGESDVWWRRVLRKKIARVVEHGAIKLGVVTRNGGGYASDDAVTRRRDQLKRNAEMLEKSLLKNEAGQVFKLSSLAKSSTSNPAVRGDELMTRIRGCEEYASVNGHVGTFWALTTPSRFHAVLVGGKTAAAKARPNPKYDGVSSPRDAQLWLRTQWARARAELAREGVEVYGFRVAEPHHDGTPHWHAMLWFKTPLAMNQGMAIIATRWFEDAGREPGAHEHRVNCKLITENGAAAYMAKYVAKNIGHYGLAESLDTLDGLEAAVWAGDVQGWQRVDAWASTWGIRQFQAIGQPSVSVWREMRRVTRDQVDECRVMHGERLPQQIHAAVHRLGDLMADWARFMSLMGGACLPRADYVLRLAKRVNDSVNGYGEALVKKTVVGVVTYGGKWLISRRQAWARVVNVPVSSPAECAALAAPWSGFNNCTARLTGRMRAALLGLDRPNLVGFRP